ncbi:MAG: deoxyribose-phosphate aldolase [Steroidobacteraceae bacterium]|jgi:deoxyribose-phosphate aldolase
MTTPARNLDTSLAPLARRVLSLVDLTSLNESDDEPRIVGLVALSSTGAGRVAAVCTWGRLVAVACRELRGSGIPVAAVANFPAGDAAIEAAAAETSAAIADGAEEVDVVFPYRELLAGKPQVGLELVRACRRACGDRALLKVILETGRLDTAECIRRAADIAIDGGAHFLKTSTGKTQPGATLEAAAVLLEALAAASRRGQYVGLKVSGGIRTLSQARSYLELYESRFGSGSANASNFRIGASALMHELLEYARVQPP